MIKKFWHQKCVLLVFCIQMLCLLCCAETYIAAEKTETKSAEQLNLKQLQEKFPDGMYWNHADNPGAEIEKNNQDSYTAIPCKHKGTIGTINQTCNGFQPEMRQLSWQCMGYAEKLGYDATGYNPRINANGWFTDTSIEALENLKPGDIVRYRNNGHSIYVTGVEGDVVTYTDCNTDGRCMILWGQSITKQELAETYAYVRVAPHEVKAGNISIKKAKVTLSNTTYTYNGKTKKPAVTLVLDKKTLKKGRDYTVSYKNTKNIGTGTVIITGAGEYEGTIKKTIQIKVKAGTIFSLDGYKYKITSVSNTRVAFAGVASESLEKITIPKTITYGGVAFKVTSISENALKNNTKIKQVTIGSNVKAIGDSAFYGCKKLKTITIKSKVLSSVGTKVLKGIYSEAKIKVPAEQYSSYKSLLRKRGQETGVTIVKYN